MRAVKYYLNAVFDVRAGYGTSVERFAVRVSRPAREARFVESELMWLSALRRDIGLLVPEPIPALGGRWTVALTHRGLDRPRLCTVFRWIEGRRRRPPLSSATLERLGWFLAMLHRHSESFDPPAGFVRPWWDLDGIAGRAVDVDPSVARGALPPDALALADRTIETVGTAMRSLVACPGSHGLIHSDLFWQNLLFRRGRLAAIDFDGCGFGLYAYDLAVPLADIRLTPAFVPARDALLRGYRKVRPVGDGEVSSLDSLIAARLLVHALWFAANAADPGLRGDCQSFLPRQLVALARVVDECERARQ